VRTTLDIDDDVLSAAKELARAHNTTAGKVISDLVRQQLRRTVEGPLTEKNGFLVLPARGGVVTEELVTTLADDL
jgi:hypothetical protein